MLQHKPGKIRPVLAAFFIWILTILAGAFLLIIIIAVDSGKPLLSNTGPYNEDYLELFSFFCLFAGLFSIPAAAVYIILFTLLARAGLPRYVAAIILSLLSAIAVYCTIRYFSDTTAEVIQIIMAGYLLPHFVFSWAGVYLSYPRHIAVPDDLPES
jgi:hypothetical protein